MRTNLNDHAPSIRLRCGSTANVAKATAVTIASELALDMACVLALDALPEREQDPDHVDALMETRTEVSDRLEKARSGHESFR